MTRGNVKGHRNTNTKLSADVTNSYKFAAITEALNFNFKLNVSGQNTKHIFGNISTWPSFGTKGHPQASGQAKFSFW